MKVAVIGAGIVGVTTAWELSRDGHEVDVFERRASVAAEASFANAGIVAPGCVVPWTAPLPLRRAWRPATLRWWWRRRRAAVPARQAAHRAALLQLARMSRDRLHAIARELRIDYERCSGVLLLLRTRDDVARARPALKTLAELGVPFRLIDAAQCRSIEPGLSAETPLLAGVHLHDDEVGNCPQLAHALRSKAQQRGARFHLHSEVHAIEPGVGPRLAHRPVDGGNAASRLADSLASAPVPGTDAFDAIVVCTGASAQALLRPHRLRLPLLAVHGYSVTAPLRQFEAFPEAGPQSALIDQRFDVTISRIGNRVRVAGGWNLRGAASDLDTSAIETLYRVLHDWYPGMAQLDQALRWQGTCAMLPDGMPIVGASGLGGIWLNLGHGTQGWALACGSARLLADAIGGRRSDTFAVDRVA